MKDDLNLPAASASRPPCSDALVKLCEYIWQNSTRGECRCGKCCDKGPDRDAPQHSVNVHFFWVGKTEACSPVELRDWLIVVLSGAILQRDEESRLLREARAEADRLRGLLEQVPHAKDCAALRCGNCIYSKHLHDELAGVLHCSTDQCIPGGDGHFTPKGKCDCIKSRVNVPATGGVKAEEAGDVPAPEIDIAAALRKALNASKESR